MFNFKSRDSEFFDLFLESAKYFHKCAVMMDEVMHDYTKAESKMREIIDLEHEADAVNDRIIDKLNQTFITPIDREDIYAMANGLDDGVDFLQGTLQRIVMYHIGNVKEGAISMTRLLLASTEEMMKAFKLLKNVKKNQSEILKCTHKISSLESEGDRVYRAEVAGLFEHVKDPIELIKWKDVLEFLEDTLDHCERVADMIRGVVMKYA